MYRPKDSEKLVRTVRLAKEILPNLPEKISIKTRKGYRMFHIEITSKSASYNYSKDKIAEYTGKTMLEAAEKLLRWYRQYMKGKENGLINPRK